MRNIALFGCGLVLMAWLAAGCAPRAGDGAGAGVFDIPRVDELRGRGFAVKSMVSRTGEIQRAHQFEPSFQLAWNERGLQVFVKVLDNSPMEADTPRLYDGDSVELFVAAGWGSPQSYQVVIAPGMDPKFPEPRKLILDHRQDKTGELSAEVTRGRDHGGYILQVFLPWKNLNLTPKLGDEIAFQIFVNDASPTADKFRCRWHPSEDAWRDSTAMYRLRLSDHANSPVVAAAGAEYQRFRRTVVRVGAMWNLAGKPVEVRHAGATLGTAKLSPDYDSTTATLNLPMPPRGKSYDVLDVLVDGKVISQLKLGDIEGPRQDELRDAHFAFRPCVFSGVRLPEGEFDSPNYVEDLAGSYKKEITYYDAAGNPVTKAEKPGRYGAVAKITLEDGQVLWRFQTLFRTAEKIDWDTADLFAAKTPLNQIGIDPAVVQHEGRLLSDGLKWIVQGSFYQFNHPDAAVLLAGLYEMKPDDPPSTRRNDAGARDDKYWAMVRAKIGAPMYAYRVVLPAGYDNDPNHKWPLVMHLHGSNVFPIDNDVKMVVGDGKQPVIVVVPQCPMHEWWNIAMVDHLLKEVCAKYHVDMDRIYLTGFSMGGFASYNLAMEFPGRFAAIAPIAGGADLQEAERIKDLPIWALHGDKDTSVKIETDDKLFAAMKKLGGRMRYTVYVNAGHVCPRPYTDQIIPWFLQQVRGKPAQGPATMPTSVPVE